MGGKIILSAKAGAKVGAAIGTVAPGADNVVGAVVAAVVGIGIAVAVDIYEDKNGNTLRDKGKDWVYGIYKSITGKER